MISSIPKKTSKSHAKYFFSQVSASFFLSLVLLLTIFLLFQCLSTFTQRPVLNPFYAYFWVLSAQAQTQLLLLCYWLQSLSCVFRPASSYAKISVPLTLCCLWSVSDLLWRSHSLQSLHFPCAISPSSASQHHCLAFRAVCLSCLSLAAKSHPCFYNSSSLWEWACFSGPFPSDPTALVTCGKATPKRSLFVRCFNSPHSSAASSCVGFHIPQSLFLHCLKALMLFSQFLHNSASWLSFQFVLQAPFLLCLKKKIYWGLQSAQQESDINLLLFWKRKINKNLFSPVCLPVWLYLLGLLVTIRVHMQVFWGRVHKAVPLFCECMSSSRKAWSWEMLSQQQTVLGLDKGLCCSVISGESYNFLSFLYIVFIYSCG